MKTGYRQPLIICALLYSLLFGGCRQITGKERPLPAPLDLRTSAQSSGSIVVSWAPVDGADGYQVYRSENESGVFVIVNSIVVACLPYEDTGLAPDTIYWYKVVALKGGEEQTMSAAFSGITNLGVPGNIAVIAPAPQQLNVSWDAVSGAEGYNLCRSSSLAGAFVRVNTVLITETSYADAGLGAGLSYWYKVVAVRGGAQQDFSNPVSGLTMLGAPENTRVSYLSGSSLRVSWDPLSVANGYNVYRGETETGGFVKVNTMPVNGTSYDDAGLALETLYWYKVVGVRDGVEQTFGAAARGFTAQVWAKTYGGSSDDVVTSLQQTADGGYIVAGVSDSYTINKSTSWVLKLDPGGAISWQKSYGSCRVLSSARQTTDAGFIMGARYFDTYTAYDFILVKLDSNGAISWQKKYGQSGSENLSCVRETSDGGYIAAGSTTSQILILKLDSSGAVSWAKAYLGTPCFANSIQETIDGGYVVAGMTGAFGAGGYDCWVLKLDSTGAVAWQKTYGGSGNDSGSCIDQTDDGGYIVAGSLSDKFWVLKLNSAGAVSWQKLFGGVGGYSIEQTTDGGYIVCGYIGSPGDDLWILKLNSNGEVAWQRKYGGSGSDQPCSIQQTNEGGYIVAGSTNSFGAGKNDYWLLKIPGTGNLESAEFMASTSIVPEESTATSMDTSVIPGTPGLGGGPYAPSAIDTSATVMTQYP
jgi:fibronectin type 3 domain-containing protein/predicted secreted protein